MAAVDVEEVQREVHMGVHQQQACKHSKCMCICLAQRVTDATVQAMQRAEAAQPERHAPRGAPPW